MSVLCEGVAAELRVVGFVTPPDLENVHADDRGLVEVVGVIALNLHKPAVVCESWRIDTYDEHYNVIFELTATAPPITDSHMRILREINYVRVQRVWVQQRDAHLQLTVQIAKAALGQIITEEQVLHIARVSRAHDQTTPGPKRQRAE
jgi:hypothetical protein